MKWIKNLFYIFAIFCYIGISFNIICYGFTNTIKKAVLKLKEAGWILVGIVFYFIISAAVSAGNNAVLIGLALLIIICAIAGKMGN